MGQKILFCSDEHVLLRRKGVPVDFEINRYELLFAKLLALSESHDIVIHGGDMFDRQPTIAEIALVVSYLNAQKISTYVIDGNHEAVKKGTSFLSELAKLVTNPYVKIVSDIRSESYKDGTIGFVPYKCLKAFTGTEFGDEEIDILVTHVRGEIPPHVKPEVDLAVFSKFPLVLAGDLHSHSNSQLNIVYPGSPLTTSFYRNKPVKGVLSVNLASKTYDFIDLNLPALIKLTVESKDEITENTTQDFIAYDIVPKVDAIIEAKEDTVFHKEACREDAILAVLDADEIKRQEVIKLYVNIIRGGS